jgi:hypothetical protein
LFGCFCKMLCVFVVCFFAEGYCRSKSSSCTDFKSSGLCENMDNGAGSLYLCQVSYNFINLKKR